MKKFLKNGLYNFVTKLFGDENNFVTLPVFTGPAKGLWFKIDLIDRKESAYILGKYDLFIIKILNKLIEPGWTIWDCGTYIGFYTCYFAKVIGKNGFVYGFEPDPRNLKRTSDNMEINNNINYKLYNYAIGSDKEQVEFILSNNSNSHLEGTYIDEKEQYKSNREEINDRIIIKSCSLDRLYNTENINFPNLIKIDIEGAEVNALKHAVKLAKNIKPIILVELHNPECFKAAWDFAKETGYLIYNLHKNQFAHALEDVNETILLFDSKLDNYYLDIIQ